MDHRSLDWIDQLQERGSDSQNVNYFNAHEQILLNGAISTPRSTKILRVVLTRGSQLATRSVQRREGKLERQIDAAGRRRSSRERC